MKVTEVQNDACFIGVMESIFADSKCPDNVKNDLLLEINKYTKDNITSIYPSKVNDIFRNSYFSEIKNQKITNLDNLKEIIHLGDYNFFIFFWDGDKFGKNRHVTRLTQVNQKSLMLMDPQSGKLKEFSFKYLKNLSPLGFQLV